MRNKSERLCDEKRKQRKKEREDVSKKRGENKHKQKTVDNGKWFG